MLFQQVRLELLLLDVDRVFFAPAHHLQLTTKFVFNFDERKVMSILPGEKAHSIRTVSHDVVECSLIYSIGVSLRHQGPVMSDQKQLKQAYLVFKLL